MNQNITKHIATAIALSLTTIASHAAVSLPAIFSDNMVIQQNSEITIWGWAKPKEPVEITTSWSNDTLRTEAAADATWSLKIATPEATDEPQTLSIRGWSHIDIRNILIGEVILCSGQSNMEWTVGAGFIGVDSIKANSDRPNVRMFNVDYRTADTPNHDVSGNWKVASPETIGSFSVIGYIIAARLSDELGVPVGIINSSWGGTPIEVWTPGEAYEMCDYLRSVNDELSDNEWGPTRPAKAYNAMIAPLAGYKISCIAWYQGEANVENPRAYTDMMSSLVSGFREAFGADIPFVYAQIAPYNYGSGKGVEIRERQRRAMFIPRTSMVVIGDLGDVDNIHPQRKTEAGNRFANALLNEVYGKKEFKYAAPLFDKMEINGSKAIVTFKNADGLHCRGSKRPNLFEIAGADGVFYPAQATLQGNAVTLQASQVKVPVAVRFAWDDTAMPNLYNAAGIQASCFTTQDEF